MNMDERIKRINELYHKSKEIGLTDAEKEEQARLRREYVDSVRGNLKAQLDSIRIERPDGTIENPGMRQQKKKLRKSILQKRDALSVDVRQAAVDLLRERIAEHPWYDAAQIILGFASYGSEIDTDRLEEEILRAGKALYLPRVEGEEICFYRVYDLAGLQEGFKGIREPALDAEKYVYDPEKDERTILLMPGVAFDREGNRLGYGKGFYDRFLEDKPGLQNRSIGIGYACQLVEQVPHEKRDVPLAQVICV